MMYLIFTQLMLVACHSDNVETKYVYNYKLTFSQNLHINLDSVSSYSPYTLQYLITKNGNEYLLASNNNTLSVDVYSLKSKTLEYRLPINDSSTQYTNNILGFWAISKDSIIVFKRQRITPLFLTLKNWEIINRNNIDAINPKMQSRFLNHASMTASPTVVLKNKLIYTEFPIGDPNKLIQDNYSPELIYDFINDSVYDSHITWPNVYHKGIWNDLVLYCKTIGENNKLVYSWEASDNLMVSTGDSTFNTPAKSDYFTKPITYDPTNINIEGRDNNLLEQNHYMMVLYDKYRQVYYRFAIHGITAKDENGYRNTPYDAPFSVIILDKDFKKIGEQYFDSNLFLPKDSFVGKKGLYISNQNGNRKDMLNEDEMSFSLFKLLKINDA